MRLCLKKKTNRKSKARLKNRVRIRKKLSGSAERPRLCVFRSGRHIYAQIVDDSKGVTIVAASTLSEEVKGRKTDAAKSVGVVLAKKAKDKNINKVVFDRSGYIFHGRVKAVADGAREGGLSF